MCGWTQPRPLARLPLIQAGTYSAKVLWPLPFNSHASSAKLQIFDMGKMLAHRRARGRMQHGG